MLGGLVPEDDGAGAGKEVRPPGFGDLRLLPGGVGLDDAGNVDCAAGDPGRLEDGRTVGEAFRARGRVGQQDGVHMLRPEGPCREKDGYRRVDASRDADHDVPEAAALDDLVPEE